MKILIKPIGNQKNYLVTIAIGKKYYNNWYKYCFPSWNLYCKKNKLVLIVIDEYLINVNHINFKKATWHKWLIGSKLQDLNIKADNISFIASKSIADASKNVQLAISKLILTEYSNLEKSNNVKSGKDTVRSLKKIIIGKNNL